MGNKTSQILSASGSLVGQKVQKFTIAPLATVTVVSAPASGFFRVFGGTSPTSVHIMPSSGNAVSVAYKARLIGPFGSLLIQQSSAYGEYSGDLLYEAPIIGPGESITIENLDGAESLDVVVTYADFANPDLTLFRQQTNGTNLVTLIPAAPVGKVNIAASVMPERSYPLSSAEKGSTVFYFNADDVAHSAQIRNAGKLINNYPTGAVSPNSATELEIVSAIDSTGLLTAQLREATNSVEGYLFGAYLEVSST